MDNDLKRHLDQYFQQFGQQVQQVQQTLGGQIQQLREDTGRQFQEMREDTARQFREMREETAEKLQEVGQRMDRIEAEARKTGVLLEDLSGQIRFVAEGIDNLRVQMERNDKELSRRIDEVMTFTRQAYRDLDARKLDKTA